MQKIIITTDKSKLDIDLIHNFLSSQARWCLGIPKSVVQTAIENSMCFAAFINGQQVGFARMVTDYATFGNVVDVFVLENFRGQGISGQLLTAINDHPDLQGLRRVMLQRLTSKRCMRSLGLIH
ncbi:GNAT family N-acetyltransferase [Marinicellulosiphila megalodicopiae]|uniref:GNAT family N-acetyltransferase n=1 Tax=Marinicellulosiphila megalodicopiae TaxID=2724896 RepID=UPI003BAFDAFC